MNNENKKQDNVITKAVKTYIELITLGRVGIAGAVKDAIVIAEGHKR